MKNSIKLLTLILLVMSLSNCETQEDPEPDTFEEDVLNRWSLHKRLISDDEDFVLTNCMKQSTLEFFEDGTFHQISYVENSEGECVETLNTSGNWDYLVPAELRLTINGETQEFVSHIGNLIIEDNEEKFEVDKNGNYLRIFNATSSNYVRSHYKKSNN